MAGGEDDEVGCEGSAVVELDVERGAIVGEAVLGDDDARAGDEAVEVGG